MSESGFPNVALFITANSWAGFAVWVGLNLGALLVVFGVVSPMADQKFIGTSFA